MSIPTIVHGSCGSNHISTAKHLLKSLLLTWLRAKDFGRNTVSSRKKCATLQKKFLIIHALWHGAYPRHCFLRGFFPLRLHCLGASFNQLHWRDLKGRNNALSADVYVCIYVYIYICWQCVVSTFRYFLLTQSIVLLLWRTERNIYKYNKSTCMQPCTHDALSLIYDPPYSFV